MDDATPLVAGWYWGRMKAADPGTYALDGDRGFRPVLVTVNNKDGKLWVYFEHLDLSLDEWIWAGRIPLPNMSTTPTRSGHFYARMVGSTDPMIPKRVGRWGGILMTADNKCSRSDSDLDEWEWGPEIPAYTPDEGQKA